MFKDYDKYLKASLKVYIFVLGIVFILKLVGLNYFGLDVNNKTLLIINKYFENLYIRDIWYFISMIIYAYIMIAITCNETKCLKYTLIVSPIIYLVQLSKSAINYGVALPFIDLMYMYILCFVFYKNKKDYKVMTKRYIFYNLISMFIQFISLIARYKYNSDYQYNFIENFILNLDYLIMTLIIYRLYFMKGDVKRCIYQMEVFSSLQKKMNLKELLKRLQKHFQEFKQLDKEKKIEYIIYSILSLLWNIFTLIVIFFIAKLNDTVIECIFITTSFWISKKMFGKAFHLKSMIQCFIVSNITYYILNRITTPIGISVLIPIMLGVGLSYITSKLVKKTYKSLYKGMSEELFNETILKVVDKDSNKYKICYEFYIENKNAIVLSMKYSYSEPGIRMIIKRVNDSIKALNK